MLLNPILLNLQATFDLYLADMDEKPADQARIITGDGAEPDSKVLENPGIDKPPTQEEEKQEALARNIFEPYEELATNGHGIETKEKVMEAEAAQEVEEVLEVAKVAQEAGEVKEVNKEEEMAEEAEEAKDSIQNSAEEAGGEAEVTEEAEEAELLVGETDIDELQVEEAREVEMPVEEDKQQEMHYSAVETVLIFTWLGFLTSCIIP